MNSSYSISLLPSWSTCGVMQGSGNKFRAQGSVLGMLTQQIDPAL